MLYSELKKLTNNRCSLDEYSVVNSLYMNAIGTKDEFDKEYAVVVWQELFGKKYDKQDKNQKEFYNKMWKLFETSKEINELDEDTKNYINDVKNGKLTFDVDIENPKYFTDKNGIRWMTETNKQFKWCTDLYIIKGNKKRLTVKY